MHSYIGTNIALRYATLRYVALRYITLHMPLAWKSPAHEAQLGGRWNQRSRPSSGWPEELAAGRLKEALGESGVELREGRLEDGSLVKTQLGCV